jgi:hypothetical protein
MYYVSKFFVCLNKACSPSVFPSYDLHCLQSTFYVVYFLCVQIFHCHLIIHFSCSNLLHAQFYILFIQIVLLHIVCSAHCIILQFQFVMITVSGWFDCLPHWRPYYYSTADCNRPLYLFSRYNSHFFVYLCFTMSSIIFSSYLLPLTEHAFHHFVSILYISHFYVYLCFTMSIIIILSYLLALTEHAFHHFVPIPWMVPLNNLLFVHNFGYAVRLE